MKTGGTYASEANHATDATVWVQALGKVWQDYWAEAHRFDSNFGPGAVLMHQ